MSKLETNTIDTVSGTSTLQVGDGNVATINLGKSGDTINVPTGATLTVPSGGLSGQNYPAFGASVASTQYITASTWTKIRFNTEILDTNNAYDPTTNYRFTVPSGQAGKYYISLDYVVQTDSNNLTYNISGIYKNGTIFKRTDMNSNSTSNAQFRRFSLNSNIIADLSVGDYIEAFAYASATSPYMSGDDVEARSFFGAYRIGA
jgi:hypothetical protein